MSCHTLAETTWFSGNKKGRKEWDWMLPKKTGSKWQCVTARECLSVAVNKGESKSSVRGSPLTWAASFLLIRFPSLIPHGGYKLPIL